MFVFNLTRRVKVVHNSGGGMGDLEAADTEESLLVSAVEVCVCLCACVCVGGPF